MMSKERGKLCHRQLTAGPETEERPFSAVGMDDATCWSMQVLAELERLCGALQAWADGKADWAGLGECVVCMMAPRGSRLRPCCHALLCAPCAAELVLRGDACPACRAAVQWYEEGAFSTSYAPV